jgi:hypothetical protein
MLSSLFMLNMLDLIYVAKCKVYDVIVTPSICTEGLICIVNKANILIHVVPKYSAKCYNHRSVSQLG